MNKKSIISKKLNLNDFEEIFREELSLYVQKCINDYKFEYTEINAKEYDHLLLKIIKTLLDSSIVAAGEHRFEEWEKGWNENLNALEEKKGNVIDQVIPRYFNKYNVIRWNGRFIQPLSEKFEKNTLSIILDWLFDKYLRNAQAIYEFGCGTGHNLLRVRNVNANAKLWGLDWTESSQKIINKLKESGVDNNIYSHNFDYFNPDEEFRLEKNSIIYTVASLEQIGDRWKKFIEYLLKEKPCLCIHIEPIGELLDSEVLLDYLSIEYFKKRRYLSGFLSGIRKLEKEGKITIFKEQRTHIGSLFIEGYSVIVWAPN